MVASDTQVVVVDAPKPPSVMQRLADIPEEEIWLASQKSARTRRAYKLDVRHFMTTLGLTSSDELRQVDHRAVIAWERTMREMELAAPSTIRRRLSALSSLFKHLVRHGHATRNPVREIERPAINRDEGINVIMLWSAAVTKGYACPLWLTFKRALELGGNVKKGEHGELVVYADRITRTETDAKGEEVEREIPFLKGYTVFNAEQCDGLPAHYYPAKPRSGKRSATPSAAGRH